jgi:hypothetical protein
VATILFGIFQEHQSTSRIRLRSQSLPPTDHSFACTRGLVSGTTPRTIVRILHGSGFNLTVDCGRIPRHMASSETKATVKVEDLLFV